MLKTSLRDVLGIEVPIILATILVNSRKGL